MTDMQFYGLAMILSVAVFGMIVLLRGQSMFMWSLAGVLVAFALALLAMTSIPADLAATLMGTTSVKFAPAGR